MPVKIVHTLSKKYDFEYFVERSNENGALNALAGERRQVEARLRFKRISGGL